MESPALLLVHSPLVGPASWEPTAEEMRRRGRRVVVPSLVGALASAPRHDAVADVVRDTHRDAGAADRVILVAHSGAGALVPSIVDRLAGHVDGIVFVDATLPHPGRTWFDGAPPEISDRLRRLVDRDGLLPPWHEWFPADVVRDLLPDATTRATLLAEIPRVPLEYFAEIAPALAAWSTRPCGYLRMSAAYDDAAAEARSRGWRVAHHDGHHLSAVTEPRVVTNAVLGLTDDLSEPSGP